MVGETGNPLDDGNLVVNDNATPQQLAQSLVGPGVTVENVTYTGAAVARGTFAGGVACGLPIDNGVILASGDITNAIGPNNNPGAGTDFGNKGDADLDNLISPYTCPDNCETTDDAAVLEFDILSSANSISFQYVFASEEYPNYDGSYDGVCAIFVDGVNTAVVPNTSVPISIYTVNADNNSQYFLENYYGDNPQPFNIQYNGLTINLTATASISPNVLHHIKIAVADARDYILDSAIFIKAHTSCP